MEQHIKSNLTITSILNHANKLIYENGFKATSIDRVMHDSQLTKGAFYHHFKNKKELGLAVINTKIENKLEEAMITPLNQPGNPFEIIKTTFINRIKSFTAYDKKHGCPLNNLINEIGDVDESYRKSLQNIIEKWTTALSALIKRGQNENVLKKNIDPNATAVYLISSYEGIRGIRKIYNDDIQLNNYIKAYTAYIDNLKY